MEQNKQLIYEGQTVELLPPMAEAGEPPAPPCPASPSRGRAWFSGLTVGVALFAAAFLLCESAHALQERLPQADAAQLEQLLQDSFLGSTAPSVTATESADGTAAETDKQPAPDSTALDSTSGAGDAPAAPPQAALTAAQLYAFDAAAVPQGMIPIVPRDLSLIDYGKAFHYNDTPYTLAPDALPATQGSIPAAAAVGEVSVLILHTHATEAYSPDGATYYDPATTLARSEDPTQSVVAVGAVLAELLNESGIVTLHSTVLHDLESYKDSYNRAAQTIAAYLAQYPSIRLVIDVHRDSIMTSSEQLVRPVTLADGEAVAQVMCVVGSDAAGADYDDWQQNFALAVRLREALNAAHGNLCRPVYVKKSTYNQQYAPASLLLEIGSSGNTLEEAKRAAALVAREIIDMLT